MKDQWGKGSVPTLPPFTRLKINTNRQLFIRNNESQKTMKCKFQNG